MENGNHSENRRCGFEKGITRPCRAVYRQINGSPLLRDLKFNECKSMTDKNDQKYVPLRLDKRLIEAIERELEKGKRVQLKRMGNGTVKAQIISAKEIK